MNFQYYDLGFVGFDDISRNKDYKVKIDQLKGFRPFNLIKEVD